MSLLSVTAQGAVREQPAIDQPSKTESELAVAVSVTSVPAVNACEQVMVQSMPAGLLVTVPAP
jgi:hypothetical protein